MSTVEPDVAKTICLTLIQIRNFNVEEKLFFRVNHGSKLLGVTKAFKNCLNSLVCINQGVELKIEKLPSDIDDIASKPVTFSIFSGEVGNDTSPVLAQCCFDLVEILMGETFLRKWCQLLPFEGSTFDENDDCFKGEVEISAKADNSLLLEEDLTGGTLMSVLMETMMPLTSAMQESNKTFVALMPMYIQDATEELAVFSSNNLWNPEEKDEDFRVKWASPQPASGLSVFMPNRRVLKGSGDKEMDELRGVCGVETMCGIRARWNQEKRFWIDARAALRLKCGILQNRYWPVQVYCVDLENLDEGASADTSLVSWHGVAFIDMSPLIHPGECRTRGAYRVVPYKNETVACMSKRQDDELLKMSLEVLKKQLASNYKPNEAKEKTDKKGDMKGDKKSDKKNEKKDKKETKRGKSAKGKKSANDDEGEDKGSLDFEKNEIFVIVDISVRFPLVAPLYNKNVTLNVSSAIPPRPLLPKIQIDPEKALSNYKEKIVESADRILTEYRSLLEENEGECPNDEKIKMELIYKLNSSGIYFSCKQLLKQAVAKLARERFNKRSVFLCQQELHEFLSELYPFLIDQMHVTLNEYIKEEEQDDKCFELCELDEDSCKKKEKKDDGCGGTKRTEGWGGKSMMKRLADDADFEGDHCYAQEYLLEIISKKQKCPEAWFDYGVHLMLFGNIEKAEECFNECVSLDGKHINGLLMAGICMTYRSCFEDALKLFEAAVCYCPSDIVAWVVLGLHYKVVNNIMLFEMAIKKAEKLRKNLLKECQKETQSTDSTEKETSSDSDKKEPKVITNCPKECSIYTFVIKLLRKYSEYVFREKALEIEASGTFFGAGKNQSYFIEMCLLNMSKKEYIEAQRHLNCAIDLNMQVPKLWSIQGHLCYSMDDTLGALEAYKRRLSYVDNIEDGEKEKCKVPLKKKSQKTICPDVLEEMHFVYLKIASIYLSFCKLEEAKKMYLQACINTPTAATWLGVGISCYKMNQLEEAEAAFSEANYLDKRNSTVWGHLCLVNLALNREYEAQHAFNFAMKLNLRDPCLYQEILERQDFTGIHF